jgi:hypothetical protein
MITTQIFLIFSSSSGNLFKNFSQGEATKKLWFSSQFMFAFTIASRIASSTISIQINSVSLFFELFIFSNDNPILPAPQYKSNKFHSKFQSIEKAVQNNFSAHKVLV